MQSPFLIGVAVAVAVVASVWLSRRSEVPAPVLLVVAGVGVSFVPGLPDVILRPDVVFYVFLPPLLYSAAFFSSPRELRANWLPIALLAFGLVLLTLFAVAGAAAVPVGIGWAAAFGLGATVAPTDPVSATAVLSRLGAPTRLRTILEGESLVNDGIALVVYRLAVVAGVGGGFSVAHGAVRFAEMAAGGIAIGVALGLLVAQLRARVHDTEVEIVVSLLTPYLAYIPAERAGLSGVLATVTTGVVLGWRSSGIFRPQTRLQAFAFWDVLTFLLESVLFVLLGAQMRVVLRGLGAYSPWQLAGYALIVVVAVMATRLLAMLAAPAASWRARIVLGWSGMRGAITLAAALALPLSFPHRDLVLFLAFTVVLATLVLQGISLPYLIRGLGLTRSEEIRRRELEARIEMTEAALARLDELVADEDVDPGAVAPLRQSYASRLDRLHASTDGDEQEVEQTRTFTDRRIALLDTQRDVLGRLRRDGEIDPETARRLQRELDLEQSRLGR